MNRNWEIEHDSEDYGPWYQIGPARIQYNWFTTIKEREELFKDAKLIAAAPDLLEAALRIKEEIDTEGLLQGSYEKLLEAIKKATE